MKRVYDWDEMGFLDLVEQTRREELKRRLDSALNLMNTSVLSLHKAYHAATAVYIPCVVRVFIENGNFDTYNLFLSLCNYLLKHPLLLERPDTIEEWDTLDEKIRKEYGQKIDAEAEVIMRFCQEYIEE